VSEAGDGLHTDGDTDGDTVRAKHVDTTTGDTIVRTSEGKACDVCRTSRPDSLHFLSRETSYT